MTGREYVVRELETAAAKIKDGAPIGAVLSGMWDRIKRAAERVRTMWDGKESENK